MTWLPLLPRQNDIVRRQRRQRLPLEVKALRMARMEVLVPSLVERAVGICHVLQIIPFLPAEDRLIIRRRSHAREHHWMLVVYSISYRQHIPAAATAPRGREHAGYLGIERPEGVRGLRIGVQVLAAGDGVAGLALRQRVCAEAIVAHEVLQIVQVLYLRLE